MPVVAIAPLAAVGIAIMALLLLLGAGYLAKFVARIMPTNIPLIGGTIRAIVEGAAQSALDAIGSALRAAVKPVEKIITGPIAVAAALYGVTLQFANQVYDQLRTIATVTVPRVITTVEAYADTAVRGLRRYLVDLIETITRQLEALITAARAYAASLVASLKRYTQDLVGTVERQLIRMIDQLRTYAEDLVRAARAAAAAALAAAVTDLTRTIDVLRSFVVAQVHALTDLIETRFSKAEADALRWARDAETAAVGTIDAAVTAGVAAVWPTLVTDVDTLVGEWEAVFPDILTGVGDIAKAIPRDIAGEAAITGVVTGVLARYLRDCGLPNCKNLGGFGRDLQALLGLVNDAAFLTLITGLALSPAVTAREVDDVIGGVARATTSTLADLVGVR